MPVFGNRMVVGTANVKHVAKVKKETEDREKGLAKWMREKEERKKNLANLHQQVCSLAAYSAHKCKKNQVQTSVLYCY